MQNAEGQIQSIMQRYSQLEEFKKYQGYINPWVDYVFGIFLIIQKDYSKAIDNLKEAYGVSQSRIIAKDLNFALKPALQKCTWILIEEGRAPFKQSEDFHLTLPLFTLKGVRFFNLSLELPLLHKGENFSQKYWLGSMDKEIKEAELIGNLDSLAFIEFNHQLPFVILRNIFSSILKLGNTGGIIFY